MKLTYIANIRLPTEKAHGLQIMKTCEALAAGGAEVELIVPKRKTPIAEDAFAYYGTERIFRITRLRSPAFGRLGKWGFRLGMFAFALRAAGRLIGHDSLCYTRDEFIAAFLGSCGKRVIWEAHMGHRNAATKLLIKMRIPMTAISRGLRDFYVAEGADPKLVAVIPDAVDLERFSLPMSREEARQNLDLKAEKLVLYTGSRYRWKGVETFESARAFVQNGIDMLIVSGRPHAEIPLYLRAADILVLPNSAAEPISSVFTSPMKLFEYMASGTPIVASDVPALREVLDESVALFFAPDDPQSLADALHAALADEAGAAKRAQAAFERARDFSWAKRAERIVGFIQP